MLPKILQQLLQVLPREEDAALHRAQGEQQALGYLAILKAREVHHKRDAILTRHSINNTINLLAIVVVLSDISIKILRAVYVKKIVGVIHESLVAHYLAVVIYENIAHYGIYPTLEICVGSIFVHIIKSLE